MRIIPAIDLINGECVRLTEGDYNTQKTYSSSPVDMAMRFEDAGLKYLHLVDLDGAKGGRVMNLKTLEQIASKTNLIIDFGGGVKSMEDLQSVLSAGANQVNIGSLAIKNPKLFSEMLQNVGPDKIILAADSKNGKVASTGWTESGDLSLESLLETFEKQGGKTVVCTDISKDGKLAGPATTLYQEIKTSFNFNLVASGGVSSIQDLQDLREVGCDGAIVGKAIYENKINLNELQKLC